MTGKSWWKSSSGAGKLKWPSWEMTVPLPPSVVKLIPAQSFTITKPNTSPTPPRPTSPARISEETEEAVRDAAVRIYQAIGCQGLSRVDFFVTYEGEDVIFNEINTLPGFTSISMYPKLFAASGIPYPELIDQLIALACEVRPS